MFEDSTFASTGRIRTRSRAGFITAGIFESVAVAALALLPLVYPQVLPHVVNTILMSVPAAPTPEPMPQPRTTQVVPTVINLAAIQAPRQIPTGIYSPDKPEPPVTWNSESLIADSKTVNETNPFAGAAPVTVVHAPLPHTVRLPSTMVEGMLIHKTIPVYPPPAQATRTQGTVILQATISRDGSIANLRVVSGPPMLERAALEAVSTWRYRPYLLNGEPIEVETTVNVVFKMDQ